MSAWLNSDLRLWNSEEGWGYAAGIGLVQTQFSPGGKSPRVSLLAPPPLAPLLHGSGGTKLYLRQGCDENHAPRPRRCCPRTCGATPADTLDPLRTGSPEKHVSGRSEGGGEASRTPKKGSQSDGKSRREGGSRRARRWRGSQSEVPSEWLGCWSDGTRRGWFVHPPPSGFAPAAASVLLLCKPSSALHKRFFLGSCSSRSGAGSLQKERLGQECIEQCV